MSTVLSTTWAMPIGAAASRLIGVTEPHPVPPADLVEPGRFGQQRDSAFHQGAPRGVDLGHGSDREADAAQAVLVGGPQPEYVVVLPRAPQPDVLRVPVDGREPPHLGVVVGGGRQGRGAELNGAKRAKRSDGRGQSNLLCGWAFHSVQRLLP